MIFRDTDIPGVVVVELEKIADERGFFARGFCAAEFADRGLAMAVAQCNVSLNLRRGTLRGLHYQAEPKPDARLVRCTRGAMFDVAVDRRPASPTYCRWMGVELDAAAHRALFVPAGCAHGFQTLTDDVEVVYLMGEAYDPALDRGVRCNDPAFAIDWPIEPTVMSERDAGFADFLPAAGKPP